MSRHLNQLHKLPLILYYNTITTPTLKITILRTKHLGSIWPLEKTSPDWPLSFIKHFAEYPLALGMPGDFLLWFCTGYLPVCAVKTHASRSLSTQRGPSISKGAICRVSFRGRQILTLYVGAQPEVATSSIGIKHPVHINEKTFNCNQKWPESSTESSHILFVILIAVPCTAAVQQQ